MKTIASIFLFVFAICSQAAELSETSTVEIKHLLQFLDNSGCQFNRNGTWYTAKEAKVHIAKKHDYLLEKKLITSAESFIEKAASKSSMSGKVYEVKCEGHVPVHSANWFNAELNKFRAAQQH
jgi:hypothetical protein